jgi:RHS repeat-associated protein
MKPLIINRKQERRSLSFGISGWAQVALLGWMMVWGDFSSRLEYVAVRTARIDCATAQPEVPMKGEPSGSERVNPTQCDGYGALPGTMKPSALVAGANVASQLGWRGHYIDPTGFYYMGARNYAPDSGTFLSPDPLGHSASMDLYSYCDGDPVNQYDADGRIGKGAATGIALGGFGQYENTTQQIAGLVGQVGSYFIPGMQGYSAARDITFSGYSASKAAYDIGENGLNLKNGSELVLSATGLIPGASGVGSALRGESSAVFQEIRQTITLGAETSAAKEVGAGTEIVQRWMSQAELQATESTGLLRGGRDGVHFVTDAANTAAQRARLRLALPQTPEIRVTLEVPSGAFSAPTRVQPRFNMPGGGMERTATGQIPVKILEVH